VSFIKKVYRYFRLLYLKLVSSNRLSLKLYYLFDSSFDREFEFTMMGRIKALSQNYEGADTSAHFRCCIHRLEKGIYHPERKEIFGFGIIDELTDELEGMKSKTPIDSSELNWGMSVIDLYLSYVDNDKARYCRKLISSIESVDYGRELVTHENIDSPRFLGLRDVCLSRESVRFFEKKDVPHSLLDAAVEIAREAPSACNRQPFQLYPLTSKAKIMEIGRLAPGTSGFLENIPMLIPVVGCLESFRHFRDRHLIYTDSGLFMGHLVLALESLGLSSCILNWTPDWDNDRKAISKLELTKDKTIICLIAVGFKGSEVSPKSDKKSVRNILRYETL